MKVILLFATWLLTLRLCAQPLPVVVPGKFETLIPVLNIGTFHMSYTNDAHSYEFDGHDPENIRQVQEIARKIAAFKPTVIVVEMVPEYDTVLQLAYKAYLDNPGMKFDHPSEIELLAYEVGRLAGTQKIYGIDYRESYNYGVADMVQGNRDSVTYNRYIQMAGYYAAGASENKLPLSELFRLMNTPRYLDFMININADILTHAASAGKAEGADEAAKYYHRNLVMYSNLNRLPLTREDRVFILMGASHTAFFNEFLNRSPKYEPVDAAAYLQ